MVRGGEKALEMVPFSGVEWTDTDREWVDMACFGGDHEEGGGGG